MKKIIRLTESDLTRIVKRVIKESAVNLSVGSKISKVTNRMWIMGRAYQLSDIMGDKTENDFDFSDATVVKKTPNGYIIKASYIFYDIDDDRKIGNPKGNYKTLNNVCLRVDNDDIIEYESGTLQLMWHNSFIQGRVTDCGEKKTETKPNPSTCDYKKIFMTFGDVKKFQTWVANVKKDKNILGPKGIDSDWGPKTKGAWNKYGCEYEKTLKLTDNKKCFEGMEYESVHDYGYKKIPENYSKVTSEGTYIYYKGTDWSSGHGRLLIAKGVGEKSFDWACSQNKLTISNMSKDSKRTEIY